MRTSIAELAELLLEVTGSDVGIHYEPAGIDLREEPDRLSRSGATEIGFDARVPLDEGLQKLIEWRGLA